MSDAQFGLLTAIPIIVSFAVTLRAMGVLSTVAHSPSAYRLPSPWCCSQ